MKNIWSLKVAGVRWLRSLYIKSERRLGQTQPAQPRSHRRTLNGTVWGWPCGSPAGSRCPCSPGCPAADSQPQPPKHHCPQAGASNSTQRRREEVAIDSLEVPILFKLLIDGFHHFQFIVLIKLDLCKKPFHLKGPWRPFLVQSFHVTHGMGGPGKDS